MRTVIFWSDTDWINPTTDKNAAITPAIKLVGHDFAEVVYGISEVWYYIAEVVYGISEVDYDIAEVVYDISEVGY